MILDPGFEPIAEMIFSLLLRFVEITVDDWGENERKVFQFEVEQLLEVAANSGFAKEQVFTEMEEMEGPLQLPLAPSSVARLFSEEAHACAWAFHFSNYYFLKNLFRQLKGRIPQL